MSMQIELREKPRKFRVFVGEKSIGEVVSFRDDNDGSAELYLSILYREKHDDNRELGWYSTLRIAAQQIIEYEHGHSKIDTVKKRKV